MAMAANTVSQTKRNLATLGFGVRAVLDGSLEHVILAFDYATFLMNQHVDGALVSSISFAEFKQVQTTGDTVSLFFNRGSPLVFTPLSEEDGTNLYQLLDSIIDNIHEILSKDSSLISNLCDSMKAKICLRHCTVTEKKFKRNKGKSKGIGFLKKPGKKKPTEPAAGQRSSTKIHGGGSSIGFIIMSEQHLLCFKEKSQEIPLYMFPLQSSEFSCKSDDNSFTFKCRGTKGTFGLPDIEQKLLWMDACTKSKSVSDNEVLDLEEKSQNLINYLGTTFDHENEEHVGMLKRLWDASHLEEEFCLKGNLWKELGFQRDDPVSDFRATGLLGLENLVYFAEHYPELFLSMCKNQQQASEMEYPFATAGINITYLLMGLLHLSPDKAWYPDFVLHPFFFFDSNAWQELYVIVFRLFDQKWNQMQVGYMGYQEVIEATRESAEELIEKRSVMGVPAIFDMLGILRMDLPNFSTDAAQKSAKAEYSFPATDAATAAPASVVSASAPVLSKISLTSLSSGAAAAALAPGDAPPERQRESETEKAKPQTKTETTVSTPSELSSSSPDLNSIEGGAKGEPSSIPKSKSEQGGLDGSDVCHSVSQEDESLTPKPRKRRNTRSKTAVELEEKDLRDQKDSSSTTPKTRHRSRSRGSVHHDKAALKSTEDNDGEKSGSERKGRDRHRKDSKATSKERDRTETRERSETREKDREVRRRERDKERDREKDKESKESKESKSSRERERDKDSRESRESKSSRERERDKSEKESKENRSSKEKEKSSRERERDSGKDKTTDDDDTEVPLRGRHRKTTNTSTSGDYEKWKKTQGKELAEGFEGTGATSGDDDRKLSTKQKLRNSFSLKRTSGIKKK